MFLSVQLKMTSVTLANGLAPNRRQVINWTNAGVAFSSDSNSPIGKWLHSRFKMFEVTLESFEYISNPLRDSLENILKWLPFILKWLHQLLLIKYKSMWCYIDLFFLSICTLIFRWTYGRTGWWRCLPEPEFWLSYPANKRNMQTYLTHIYLSENHSICEPHGPLQICFHCSPVVKYFQLTHRV